MPSSAPSPKLTRTTALAKAQALATRVQALVPTLTTGLSPITVYQPGVPAVAWGTNASGTGNVLKAGAAGTTGGTISGPTSGVWVAPDANGDGSDYLVQVECFGAGGGGGGGNSTTGGGGGGGGEYAAESAYTVTPGKSYVWVVGTQPCGGNPVSGLVTPGATTGPTIFDLLGTGLPGGVVAQGGSGGDQAAVGTGGRGGTGSVNTVHADGGAGATVVSGIGSDNPLALSQVPGNWVNGGGYKAIPAWYMMDDTIPFRTNISTLSDFTSNKNDATINRLAGQFFSYFYTNNATPAPVQVPTSTTAAGQVATNATTQGNQAYVPGTVNGTANAIVQLPTLGLSNISYMTISCWITSLTGVFGSTTPGTWATLATNALGSAYTGSGNMTGFALGLVNVGTASNPSWIVKFRVGNNTFNSVGTAQGLLNMNGPNHIVATFNHGAMTVYVNGVQAGTNTASITSLPASGYNIALFGSPDSAHIAGYSGTMSNMWFASDVLTASGVAEAFGSAPAQGGAGGGAAGGAGGTGGNGSAPSGATGGAGGNPAVPGVSSAAWTTPGNAGSAGGNGGSNAALDTQNFGGGGGGSGNTASPFSGGTATFSFPAAASYNGTDASGGAASGALYNNPQPGTNSVLYTGASQNDYASGAKNTMLVLDPSIYSFLGFTPSKSAPGYWQTTKTVTGITLTLYNANPGSTVPVIVNLGLAPDTALPGSYTASDLMNLSKMLPDVVIPAGAASVTVDLTFTDLLTALTGGFPTKPGAIILGPGSTPGFEAYGQPAAPAFNAQVYGPGALGPDGVTPVSPVLTITYMNNGGTNGGLSFLSAGAPGAAGAIYVSYVNGEGIPVAGIEPFQTTDSAGTTWAKGFTGPATTWDPVQALSGVYVPETWHSLGTLAGYSVTVGRYRMTPGGDTELDIFVTGGGSNAASVAFSNTLPAPYRLGNGAASTSYALGNNTPANETATGGPPRIVIASGGSVSIAGPASTTAAYSGGCFVPTS